MSWEKQNLKANLGFSLSGGFFFLMCFLRVISFSFECGLKIRFR